jgi:hypothetical protein
LFLILAGLIATRWYPALEKQFIPLIWVFALFSGSWVVQKMVSPRAKKALSALQGKTDFRMLSTLLHLINEKHDDVGKIATQELIRLLPLLKPEDRRYLNDEEMKLLLRPLQGSDTELILAILKGLEQIGDERAIPAVTRLAERTAATRRKTLREMINSPVFIEGKIVDPKIKVEREISAAARACLPFLHQRVHDSMLSSTLLRASERNCCVLRLLPSNSMRQNCCAQPPEFEMRALKIPGMVSCGRASIRTRTPQNRYVRRTFVAKRHPDGYFQCPSKIETERTKP